MKIRIALADDNHFLTESIIEKLSFFKDLEFRYSALNGKILLDKLKKDSHIDLILMDIEMPEMNGIQATELVKKTYPHIKVVMLTVMDNDENIFLSIKAGADGYLLKDVDPTTLHAGIVETMSGGAAMTPSIAVRTLKLLRNPPAWDNPTDEHEKINLSKRETEVLEHLSTGQSYTQIAAHLILSPGTVRKHIENIYKKLNVCNKLEAIQKAERNRLI